MLEDSISRADYPCIKLTGYWHAHNTHAHTHKHAIYKMAEKRLRLEQNGDENSNKRVKQEVESKHTKRTDCVKKSRDLIDHFQSSGGTSFSVHVRTHPSLNSTLKS